MPGVLHDASEDGNLVLQEEGRERDGEDEADVFSPITDQHAESDEVHG
jgi:hypothetical protein